MLQSKSAAAPDPPFITGHWVSPLRNSGRERAGGKGREILEEKSGEDSVIVKKGEGSGKNVLKN